MNFKPQKVLHLKDELAKKNPKLQGRKSNTITTERLASVLDYNPITGVFLWKQSVGGSSKEGKQAGYTTPLGYLRIIIDKIPIEGQVAALRLSGIEIPVGSHVDHINKDPRDNRLINLRLASYSENQYNASGWVNNSTGIKGISIMPDGRLIARVSVSGERITKTFAASKLQEAEEWVIKTRTLNHKEFASHV